MTEAQTTIALIFNVVKELWAKEKVHPYKSLEREYAECTADIAIKFAEWHTSEEFNNLFSTGEPIEYQFDHFITNIYQK